MGEESTEKARAILLEALEDPAGTIYITAAGYGDKTFEVQVSGKEPLNPPGDHRAAAEWEEAFNSLVGRGLLAGGGSEFRLTAAGYRLAESIRDEAPRIDTKGETP